MAYNARQSGILLYILYFVGRKKTNKAPLSASQFGTNLSCVTFKTSWTNFPKSFLIQLGLDTCSLILIGVAGWYLTK
jgi:hypothetical protein